MSNVFPYPQYMPTRNQGIGIVVLLVLAYVIYRVGLNRGWFKQKVDAADTKLPSGGSGLRAGWDPNPWVVLLKEQITKTSFGLTDEGRCNAYKEFYEKTSDDEFIDVCNTYKNKHKSTIKTDMSKTMRSGCTVFTTQWDEKVLERMDKLNVIA